MITRIQDTPPIVTRNFRATCFADRLVVQRKSKPVLMSLLGLLLMFGILATLSCMGIFVYHYGVLGNSVFLGLLCLFLLPFFSDIVSRLSVKPIVLDRLRREICVGSKVTCDLAALRQVEVKDYYFQERKIRPHMVQLMLMAGGGEALVIQESVVFSVEEVRVVGQAIADFAGVELVCPSETTDQASLDETADEEAEGMEPLQESLPSSRERLDNAPTL